MARCTESQLLLQLLEMRIIISLVHVHVHMHVYRLNVSVKSVTAGDRDRAKRVVYAIVYGVGEEISNMGSTQGSQPISRQYDYSDVFFCSR